MNPYPNRTKKQPKIFGKSRELAGDDAMPEPEKETERSPERKRGGER